MTLHQFMVETNWILFGYMVAVILGTVIAVSLLSRKSK